MKTVGKIKEMTFWSANYPSKSIIILISGKAGVGKSYLAEQLSKELGKSGYSSTIRHFSEGVKDCAIEFFNWDGVKDSKGRRLLQNIGNVGREYNNNNWVERLMLSIEDGLFSSDVYIIDDWRFENEFDFIKKSGVYYIITVRVLSEIRGGLEEPELSEDVSEISLPDQEEYYDFVFYNDDTSEDKFSQFSEMITNYIEKMEIKNG